MREPPVDLDEAELLDLVRREWDHDVESLAHLPIGFGAHHWAATVAGQRRLFVTRDRLGSKRSRPELENAYAAAATLAVSGLEFVLGCLPSRQGGCTVPLGEAAVSATPWVEGETGDGTFSGAAEAGACAELLARLHATPAPPGTPRWRPLVPPPFPEQLERGLATSWHSGPYCERVQAALLAKLAEITRWTDAYHRLAEQALGRQDSWGATHGEPDTGNQVVTPTRRYLVDWESLKLAPKERDLRLFADLGHREALAGRGLDWSMVEMFDLEWRLDEISQYASWFAAPHTATASDAVAYRGLLHELERPDWSPP